MQSLLPCCTDDEKWTQQEQEHGKKNKYWH